MKNIKVGLFLTVKSILRGNKVLFTMSVLILMLVYINLMFMPNLIQGLINTIYIKIQDTAVSQIQIDPSGDLSIISNSDALISELQMIENVEGVTPLFNIPSELSFEGNRTNYGTIVIDENSFLDAFNVDEYMAEGEFFNNGIGTNQIVFGAEVAGRGSFDEIRGALIGVEVGDTVTMSVSGIQTEFEVVGIYDAEFAETDTFSYIRLSDFENANIPISTEPQRIHVAVEDQEDIDQVVNDINNLGYSINANSWERVGGVIDSTAESFDIMAAIIQIVSLIIGAITVFIISYVELANKAKHIGIQRAIGITPESIFLHYIFRGIIIGLVAIVAGMLLYVLVIIPIEHRYPIQFPFGEAKIALDITYSISMAAILMVVVIISSAIPTWQTLRQSILKAIWG